MRICCEEHHDLFVTLFIGLVPDNSQQTNDNPRVCVLKKNLCHLKVMNTDKKEQRTAGRVRVDVLRVAKTRYVGFPRFHGRQPAGASTLELARRGA